MARLVLIVIALLLVAPIVNAELQVVQPTRSHGYFIGDIVQQRINLETSVGTVAAKDLESELRIDDYLYRLPTQEVTVKKQKWLELRYQIINSPLETETIALPAVLFVSESGEELQLQPWPLTVAPLTAFNDGEETSPLPNRQALDVIAKPNKPLLRFAIAALATTLLLWLLWWLFRHFRDSHTLPFAQAQRTINKISAAKRDSDPDAWIALHRAFNKVAGKTVSLSSLDELFAIAPWVSKHKVDVEAFFEASSERFYQQLEPQSVAVSNLCNTLVREEKRQAKQSVSPQPVGTTG